MIPEWMKAHCYLNALDLDLKFKKNGQLMILAVSI